MTWLVAADPGTPSSPWAVLGLLVITVGGIITTILTGRRSTGNHSATNATNPPAATNQIAEAATSAAVNSTIEIYDRIIGAPLREQHNRLQTRFDELQRKYDDNLNSLQQARAEVTIKNSQSTDMHQQVIDLQTQLAAAQLENNRLLIALGHRDSGTTTPRSTQDGGAVS